MNIRHLISLLCVAAVLSVIGLDAESQENLPPWLSKEVADQVRGAHDQKTKDIDAAEAARVAKEAERKAQEEAQKAERKAREDYSKGIVPELTKAESQAVAKPEVSLDLYYKAAGFWYEDRNLHTLLTYGSHQLRLEGNELQKKYRAADEFDRPAIRKQIEAFDERVQEKKEEIRSKTFVQEYNDLSPSEVTVSGRKSSFTLPVGRGFLPIGRDFGKFSSPFRGVTATIRENEYSEMEVIVANQLRQVLPRWSRITISGDTETIQAFVRDMRANPKAYSLKLRFKELQRVSNQRYELDFNNPFGARTRTEFFVLAQIVEIEIINKESRSDDSSKGNAGATASATSAKTGKNNDPTTSSDPAPSSAPALTDPAAWLKPLQDAKLKNPQVDMQRAVALLKYATATKVDATYFQARDDFFKAMKRNEPNPFERVDYINDYVLPEMIRRKNFDGLKVAMTDIDVLPEPKYRYPFGDRVYPNRWYANARLAGFALAMNDEQRANAYLAVCNGMYENFSKEAKAIQLIVAEKPLDFKGTKPHKYSEIFVQRYGYSEANVALMSSIAYNLARNGDKEGYTEFATHMKTRSGYNNFTEFIFVMADALLGEFDNARLRWKRYPTRDTGPWSHFLLSYIIRQEFLAGEFRGWDTMQDDQPIRKLNTIYENNVRNVDFFFAVPAFYFDYGRGFGRHKTAKEIKAEYDTLSGASYINEEELAFFMAGVATGLMDKNPKLASPSGKSGQTSKPEARKETPEKSSQQQKNNKEQSPGSRNAFSGVVDFFENMNPKQSPGEQEDSVRTPSDKQKSPEQTPSNKQKNSKR